ncbi:MAG: heparinase II/III family protein [Planctomycetota bacterium]|nr:heparinase II/III family protein [Planctomycetota bacterium]
MSLKHATAALTIVLTMTYANPCLAAPEGADPLAALRPAHPRIWVTGDDLPRLKESVQKNRLARKYFGIVEKAGVATLDDKPAERVLVGPRLLSVSRATLKKVRTWAGLYLVTGEKRFADRAVRELRTVAAFNDWNPSHFLDVAEMTAACGIGYDWLYDVMTEDDRAVVRSAIVKHGLTPGVEAYRAKASWTTRTNNWAQVCSGGLSIGALAIGDEEPELAREVVTSARDALEAPMTVFGPDGGFSEGPGYWNYATQYTVYYLAALETALGNDFGYAASPGLAETGLFRIHTIGPSGLTFNYADATEHAGQAPQMFWMARMYDHPEYAAHERNLVGPNVDFLHLLWLDPRGDAKTLKPLPTSSFFRGVDVATFRSSWNDDDAVFVAVKGGDNKASHAHLDLGGFVLDIGKRRWVRDPGPDDYNLPGYFGKLRWTYYHLNTEGQNTLQIDGANQVLDAKAKIIEFDEGKGAVIDLSAAYAPKAKVKRSVRLIEQGVQVEDEIVAAEPVDVIWAVHTMATVEIDEGGASAVLRQGEDRLHVAVVSPPNAKLETKPVAPPAPQRTREGMTKLTVRPPEKVSDARIIVRFSREKVAPR